MVNLKSPQEQKLSWRPKGRGAGGSKTRKLQPAALPAPRAASKVRKAQAVPAAARSRNNVLLGVAAGLALLAGLFAWSVAQSFDQTVKVLVADRPVAEGQQLVDGDVRIVEIAAAEGDIQVLAPTKKDQLLGLTAAGPIGEGTLLHPRQFVQTNDTESVTVGAALGPNSYPTRDLINGDVVRLIELSTSRRSSDESFRTGRELAVGEIVQVTDLGQADSIHVSIRVSESVAAVVADRIAEDRLSLALVDGAIDLSAVVPLEPAQAVIPADLLDLELGEDQ